MGRTLGSARGWTLISSLPPRPQATQKSDIPQSLFEPGLNSSTIEIGYIVGGGGEFRLKITSLVLSISTEQAVGCIPQCKPGFTGPDGGPCHSCGEGKFKSGFGETPLSMCATLTRTHTHSHTRLTLPSIWIKYALHRSNSTLTFPALLAGSSECVSCAGGMLSRRGSNSSEDCYTLCPPGYTLNGTVRTNGTVVNGTVVNNPQSCTICPARTYKSEAGEGCGC